MRAIHTIALCRSSRSYAAVRREARPRTNWPSGFGGLPSLSRSDAPSLNAGPGMGLQVNYGRRFLDGNKLACTAKSTFWPVRFAKFLRALRQLLKTSPVSMSRPVCGSKLFRSQGSRRTWPSAADTRTMSKVRPRLTANQIRHPGSLLAESSISARASTFGYGVGSP